MTRRPTSVLVALVTAVLMAGAAGCGNNADSEASASTTPSASPSPTATSATPTPAPAKTWTAAQIAQLPACSDVWQAGHSIPAGYKACREGRAAVEPKRQGCSSGQTLLTHRGQWFGVAGGKVNG